MATDEAKKEFRKKYLINPTEHSRRVRENALRQKLKEKMAYKPNKGVELEDERQ